MKTRVIEIYCCRECPHVRYHNQCYSCTLEKRDLDQPGELCPPNWCPLANINEIPESIEKIFQQFNDLKFLINKLPKE